jgi:hypothetical protein
MALVARPAAVNAEPAITITRESAIRFWFIFYHQSKRQNGGVMP